MVLTSIFFLDHSLPKPPLRLVISRPQPLESRIPVRQKHESREVANDENNPVSPSQFPRPRSRLRLTSSTSVDTVRDHDHDSPEKLHSPPRLERAVRPLKGVLKKSASENQSHTPLDSTTPSHPRASSEPEQHNHSRAASVLATSTVTSKLKIKEPKFSKRLRTSSWMPFPNRGDQHSRAALEVAAASSPATLKAKPQVQTQKHVASTSSDQDHWSDIAMELDGPSHSSGVTVSAPRKRKAEDIADPRYGPHSPPSSPPGSPVMSRKKLPPIPTRTRMGEIVDEALKDFARERSVVFRPVITKLGPPAVLQRISADIVPHERHSTIWDADESDIYAWGGTLLLRNSKTASYSYPRHCIQDLRIELFMHDEPTSSPPVPSIEMSDEDVDEDLRPRYSWSTSYKGHRIPHSRP
ncbi:hypothetical protein C8Q74DRAFT_1374429 [Fomes fomentarius]|nr:hypothetical protein C8Q74DRAFT_1374429 [Fomes fomentarius]